MPDFDPSLGYMPYADTHLAHAPTGPLAGLTFAVKDLFDVAGMPTSAGNPLMLAKLGVRSHTAAAVQRLLDAGARFTGKTVTDELAFSLNGQNAHFGSPINGAAPDRISGGSSSGSAAVVSWGLCDTALGTDTGGSVRGPASHCGLFGVRPTHGRIPLAGAVDLAPSFDTCGFFARDGLTFTRVADTLLPEDEVVLESPECLLPPDLWTLAEDEARPVLAAGWARAQAALGLSCSAPAVALDSFDAMFWSFRYIQGHEAWKTHGGFISRFKSPLGPGVAERFAWSSTITDEQFSGAVAFRARFKAHLAGLLESSRVLVLPTMPNVAPLRTTPESSLEDYRNRALRLLCLGGLSGFPQVSVPGLRIGGVPIGLSLLGPAGSDRSLVRLAAKVGAALAQA